MFKTYVKLAFRSLARNRVFSFINVFGLAIGLTCCLLISMYIYTELSYDTQHALGNRLYQLGTISINEGKMDRYATTPAPIGPNMKQVFPEIESTTRLMPAFQDDKTLLQYNAKDNVRSFYETKAYFADLTFFRLFTYKFREGNPNTALNEPTSLVISEEIAKKIFGNEPALGKTIHINSTTNGEFDFIVTGVFVPSKTPSHIDARLFMSTQSGEVGPWIQGINDMVNNNLFYTYFLLKPGTDPKSLEAKFPAFINRYMSADLKNTGRQRNQFLTRVADIHLYAIPRAM